MSVFNNNKFLGNGGFGSNDGTATLNIGKIQIQNLSPNSLVATDSKRNLKSVPYTNTVYFSLSQPVLYPNPDTPFATWASNSQGLVLFSRIDTTQDCVITIDPEETFSTAIVGKSGDYLLQATASVSGASNGILAHLCIATLTNGTVDATNQVLFNGSSCNVSLSVIKYLQAGSQIQLVYQTENLQANAQCADPSIKLWGANLSATMLREYDNDDEDTPNIT
jgi:hypothetical protein